jgi:GNAT superfamily N-acetyltransferase
MSFLPRLIKNNELDKLLELYKFLNIGDVQAEYDSLKKSWKEITGNPDKYIYFVIDDCEKFISTCNVTIIPNLTRGARSFAVIENVVTHPDFRRCGLGEIVMKEAIKYAKERNCYKIMLLSNAKRKEAHLFYEKLGFNSTDKVGFSYYLK